MRSLKAAARGANSVQDWRRFRQELTGPRAAEDGQVHGPVIAHFGDVASEYLALADGPALVDRWDRGLLAVAGADRASWLHNLTTNQVANVAAGDGNYAFCTNLQGRILFDLNLLVSAEAIWVDLDRRFLATAQAHFEKYKIIEDVTVGDRSDELVRVGVAGTRAFEVAETLGIPQAGRMPQLGHAVTHWQGVSITLVRHDFCGPPAVELYVPAGSAADLWRWLVDSAGAVPVGDEAVQIRRIEAGIPWPGHEITSEYLPAETRQLARAVSFNKGCYLGQEVVERMRSRGVVARQLVGLGFEGDAAWAAGAALAAEDGSAVGQVTSFCHTAVTGPGLGLGYVKTAAVAAGTRLIAAADGRRAAATVAPLPFSPVPK